MDDNDVMDKIFELAFEAGERYGRLACKYDRECNTLTQQIAAMSGELREANRFIVENAAKLKRDDIVPSMISEEVDRATEYAITGIDEGHEEPL